MASLKPASVIGVDPVIEEARERWQRCEEAEDAQRKRILTAKKFRSGDQWDPDIKAARAGKNALQGVGAQPPRPCLTIDRLSQPVRQVSNQVKTANFAIDVTPQGHGADDDTAEIIKGYLRRIQTQARDESPIEWAADGAIEGGLGWFRLRTDYVDHDPGPDAGIEAFDQEPRLERIANSLSVYCDPHANTPTRRDMRYGFVTEDIAREDHEDRWPEADVESLDDFMATGDPKMRDWVTEDTIRIAEYWRVTFTEEKWVELVDGSVQQVESFPKDGVRQQRLVRRPKVEGFKINACQVLETMEWVGSTIPLIPVLGEELNVDGDIILRGMIMEGMDAQRMVNYTYSGAMETFALAPKAPFVAAAGQVEMYKAIWETANTYNYSYLPYDPVDVAGHPVAPPQRNSTEPPIQAAVELMRVSEEAIKAVTGIFDPSLGQTNPKERSGRAIQALQGQGDLGSSNYANGVQRALVYAGNMIVEILPKIIRPGQILHVLGLDDEPKKVIAGQPFVSQKGNPIPVSHDEAAQMQPGMAQFYDLTKGRYAVSVKVGKANATKREEGAAALGELIPHLPPEMAAVATPDYVEQLDFDGSHQIAEKLRKALPPQLQEQPEDDQVPPALKAHIQALEAQLQQAQKLIETDGAKEQARQQTAMQKAQLDGVIEKSRQQFELQLHAMDNAARIEIARIGAKTARADTVAGMAEEAIALDHEAVQQQHDRVHDVNMAQMDHAHALQQGQAGVAGDAALADQGHQQALEQGAQGHEQALEQTQQAADLAPEPAAGGE